MLQQLDPVIGLLLAPRFYQLQRLHHQIFGKIALLLRLAIFSQASGSHPGKKESLRLSLKNCQSWKFAPASA